MPAIKTDITEDSSLANEAYFTVREQILRGELGIGKVISRRKIASELGMSLVPVSEALMRLELEGLLESRPRAGTRVRIPTEEDVRGHYIVREALEVAAARLFTEVATAQDRAELQKLAARVDTLAAQPDGNRFLYLSLHEKLHRRIAESTKCQALCDAIERQNALSSTWLCVSKPESLVSPYRRHQDLVEILTKGDANAAEEAMRNHIQRALKNTLQRLAPYFQMHDTDNETYIRSEKANKTSKKSK